MDVLLLILAIVLLLAGLAGAVLPIPGPPVSFVGIICLHYSKYASFGENLLIGLGVLTVLITILDYYSPIWFTKRFGGSRRGSIGATVGLIIGLIFMGPFFIFGPFLGALAGELSMGTSLSQAIRPALGSFVGFLAGVFMKVALCVSMIFYASRELINYF